MRPSRMIVNVKWLKGSTDGILQGIGLIQDLITEYGLDVVQAYMNHIQACFNYFLISALTDYQVYLH